MNVNKGDKITKKSLTDMISQKYDSIISSIVNYIPLGFNDLYTITAQKIFNIRPKVVQNTYSTRTGSIVDVAGGDTSQSNIGAAYLGSPYTLELGEALGLATYSNSGLGSSEQPFIKAEPLLAYEPVTDLIGGGVPFHGNTPFMWRGYMAFSNFFEDTNIRTIVSSDGNTFTLTAKSISVMIRAQATTDFTMGTDSMNTYTDRSNLEMKTLSSVNINATSASLVEGTGAGDYLIWLIYNPTTLDKLLIGVKWTSDLTTINGIVNIPYSDYFTDYAGYTYTRPIAVVYWDGTDFITTKQQAWGELATTTNAEPIYGKQYQQVSSPDPIIRENTSTDDRRMIPSYHYMDQKNNTIIGKTVYSGLVRHIPGAGGNRIKMQIQSGDYSGAGAVKIDINQCELTDGSTSIWVKDLDIPPLNVTSTTAATDLVHLNGESQTGYAGYLWLCADTRSMLDPTGSETNNLRLKLFLSNSPTWNPDWDSSTILDNAKRYGNSGVGSNYSKYTHRCRIGWLRIYYFGAYNDQSGGYRMHNGVYTIDSDLLGRTYNGLTSLNSFTGGWTIGTGYTTGGAYTLISTGTSIPIWATLPYFGSLGTSLACTEMRIGLYLNSGTAISMGTAPWVAVTTSIDRHDNYRKGSGTEGTRPSTDGYRSDVCCLGYEYGNAGAVGGLAQTLGYGIYTLPIDVDGQTRLYYAGTGGEGAVIGGNTRRAVVQGFTLPIGNF
jgi:hypothetical protein